MKKITLLFCLLLFHTNFAQSTSAKKEILRLCTRIAELNQTNHLIDNKYQLFVVSNNLFSDVEGLTVFDNPIMFVPSITNTAVSYINFVSLDFENTNSSKAVFSYNCQSCQSWNYEVDFELKESWVIARTKIELKNK